MSTLLRTEAPRDVTNGFGEMNDAYVEIALCRQRHAEVVMRLEVVRNQPQCGDIVGVCPEDTGVGPFRGRTK